MILLRFLSVHGLFSVYYRRIEAEKKIQQLRNDMDTLNSQIGECEGELASIRGRCGMLEEENKRLKEKIDRLEGQLASVRNVSV